MQETIMLTSSMFEGVLVDRKILVLHFTTNNSWYEYRELTAEQIDGLIKAESKGKYFIQNLQKTAKFKKLK